MTLDGYCKSGVYYGVKKLKGGYIDKYHDAQSCDEFILDCETAAEGLGRRIDYRGVDDLDEFFLWLDMYCSALDGNGSAKEVEGAGKIYEFSAAYFFGYAGIDYCGATLKMEELLMLDGDEVYKLNVPVIFLHIVVGDKMWDVPIYPGHRFWGEGEFPGGKDWSVSIGDVALRVVEKTQKTGDGYFGKYWSPVYIGVINGVIRMLDRGTYMKWDVWDRNMRDAVSDFILRVEDGDGARYESDGDMSSDDLRELTLEAMGYDLDDYRDRYATDYLW